MTDSPRFDLAAQIDRLGADMEGKPREIAFTIPYALDSLNIRDRKHFGQKHRDQDRLKMEVIAALGGTRYLPRPPFARARVTVVRCSAGQPDADNAVASVKPLLDVLCVASGVHRHGVGIIEDDSPRHIDLVVKQSDARRGEAMTLVRVIELPPLPAQPATVPVKKRRRGAPGGLKRVSKAGISHGITSAKQVGIGRGR
jgi:hypothetical protein